MILSNYSKQLLQRKLIVEGGVLPKCSKQLLQRKLIVEGGVLPGHCIDAEISLKAASGKTQTTVLGKNRCIYLRTFFIQ